MTVAIPSARNIARGSWRDGLARSLAVKVMMPKPRNAKKVSATDEMMSWNDGYPENASSGTGGMFARRRDHQESAGSPVTT